MPDLSCPDQKARRWQRTKSRRVPRGTDPYIGGMLARRYGMALSDNPWRTDDDRELWETGWNETETDGLGERTIIARKHKHPSGKMPGRLASSARVRQSTDSGRC